MRPTLLCSIIYSLVAFPLTPKYMACSGYFTFSFRCVLVIRFHIYCRVIYRIFLLYDMTISDVQKRTVICGILWICERIADLSLRKSCGCYIVGTLTNKPNIII